jgi:SET domain-containing protein
MSTNGRGFGVRAMRPFKPNQIIVEYTGEIINQQEADRRMNEDYKDKTVKKYEPS